MKRTNANEIFSKVDAYLLGHKRQPGGYCRSRIEHNQHWRLLDRQKQRREDDGKERDRGNYREE